MAARRVLIAWTSPLFYEAMRLLLNHPDVELAGETREYGAVTTLVEDLSPDIVIVEQAADDHSADKALPILTASQWQARVVCLGLQDNILRVYRRDTYIVAQPDDLLNLVLE